jgi:predicted mannosyl-3-phosphoglycerate phosphatase (HAD superfamily)
MANQVTLRVESEKRGVFDATFTAGDSVNADPLFLKHVVERLWVKVSEEMYMVAEITEEEAAEKLRELGFEVVERREA